MSNKNQHPYVIHPASIFTFSTYSVFIDHARKMSLLNISAVELFISIQRPDLSEAESLFNDLARFHNLCTELMNLNHEHGYYRPSELDIRRLLSWLDVKKELESKLRAKISVVAL